MPKTGESAATRRKRNMTKFSGYSVAVSSGASTPKQTQSANAKINRYSRSLFGDAPKNNRKRVIYGDKK